MFPIYPDLNKKHILITGGSNGIGEALTRTFAQQQVSQITILDLDHDKGLKIAQDCQSLGCKVNVYPVDLTNTSQLEKTLKKIW